MKNFIKENWFKLIVIILIIIFLLILSNLSINIYEYEGGGISIPNITL